MCNRQVFSHRALVLFFMLLAAGALLAQKSLQAGDVTVASDVRLHFVMGGKADAPLTLVFIPGWTLSSAVWRDQMERFAGEYRVVSADPRSQGDSTITTNGNTPDQRARDLHAMIAALHLRNVVLVGWSQGVQDVAAYAEQFGGEEIAGYVLVDASVGQGPEVATANARNLQQQLERLALYEQHPREYLEGMMRAIIQSPEARTQIDDLVKISLRTPPDLGVSMLLMDFLAVDRRGALEKFDRPTLVIASAESPELTVQQAMAKQIHDARIETIEKAGHAVFLDQPGKFHAILGKFLAERVKQ